MAKAKEEVKAPAPADEPKDTRILAKFVQLGLGTDLLGQQTSLSVSNSTNRNKPGKRAESLEVTPLGVKAVSGKNDRVLLIPWSNIRALELM